MTQTPVQNRPLFQASAEIALAATPDQTYALVSDLPRSGEWSVECLGGSWVSGQPATLGAVFRGENHRPDDVVGWAPVVRGDWTTEAEVVSAEPGRLFEWAMRTKAGQRQQSVWGFLIQPVASGSRLVHRFRMDQPTEGIRGITAEMSPAEKDRFFAEWGAKIEHDLAETVRRIKGILERR
jgi:polyketide cyclase/dehydrase/lipid transport protein